MFVVGSQLPARIPQEDTQDLPEVCLCSKGGLRVASTLDNVLDGSFPASVLAALHAGLDDANEASFVTLPVEELSDVLMEAFVLQERAKALFARVALEATNQQVAQRHGEHSLSTHVAGQVHGNSKRIGADLALMRWLHRFPQLLTAWTDGTITVSHLNGLREMARKHPKASSCMENAQGFFVESAIELQFPQWVDAIGYWFNSLDPDGKLTDPSDPKYGANVTKLPSGDVIVHMRLDPVTGEAFLVATEHIEQAIFKNGEDSEDPLQDMSPRQRTMAAIMTLITRGFQKDDGTFPEPMMQLVMSEKVAEDLLARTMGCVDPDGDGPMDFDPFEVPINYGDLDGRCETLRGTPIHPVHALLPLLVGKMRRLVMDEYGNPTEEPRDVPESRFFTRKQRQVLLAQARGKCGIAGCNNPYAWLQMDHIRPHSFGGPTLLPNGMPLCQPHNQAKGNRKAA